MRRAPEGFRDTVREAVDVVMLFCRDGKSGRGLPQSRTLARGRKMRV